ncbi:MAG: hypothetical protein HOP15_11645 [Planctomycetes bacterium]|nr:hypothetical protein [Planctomycetota bacterium]
MDIVYSRAPLNLERLVRALAGLQPARSTTRAALSLGCQDSEDGAELHPVDEPVTSLGDIDLFGEVSGGGTFEQLSEHAETVEVLGLTCSLRRSTDAHPSEEGRRPAEGFGGHRRARSHPRGA